MRRVAVISAVVLSCATAQAQNAMPGAWWPTSDMAAGRNVYVMGHLLDGRVLVAGGSTMYGEAGTELATVEIWNPATQTWAPANPLNTARAWAVGAVLNDGRVLVAGGNETALATAELWTPATGLWTITNPMAGARWRHTATKLADGRVLVVGGASAGVALATAEIFNPATNTWSATANNLTQARANHRAVLLQDGRVLVVGGSDGNETVAYASAEVWNPATNLWSSAGSMAETRSMTGLALLADGRALVASGGIGNSFYRDTTEIWDPATNTWTLMASRVRAGRSWPFAQTLADGRVLLAGGFNHTLGAGENVVNSHLKIAEIWDPATQSWHNTGSMVGARDYCFTVRLPDGRVLVVGGDDGGATLNNIRGAEVFDPETGTFHPFEFSLSTTATPQAVMRGTDAQNDEIRYELQYSTDPNFVAGVTMVNSSNGGFVNLANGADAEPFAQGQPAGYTLPSLAAGTWWWRARFNDPLGLDRYTGWSASRSFTIPALFPTDKPFFFTSTGQLQRGRPTSINVTTDRLSLGVVSANTGMVSPTTNPSGTWTNGAGALADAGTITTGNDGDLGVYGGFGFGAIPMAATITGIVVSVDAFKSGTGPSTNTALDLEVSNDGGTTWSVAKRITPLPTVEALRTQGSSADLWGLAFTTANIGNLAVRMTAVKVGGGNPTFNVDWLRVTVHYSTVASNGNWVSPLVRNSYLSNANGRSWSRLVWTETPTGVCTPPMCDVTADVLDMSGNPIAGFSSTLSPVSLLGLDPAVHPVVRVRMNVVSGGMSPPTIDDVTIDTIGGTPLSADVSGLAAAREGDAARVTWSAGAGTLLSFKVLRADSETGPFAPLGEVGADLEPRDYAWLDGAPPATQVWYALDVRETNGAVTRIGPVRLEATQGPASAPGCGCRTTRSAAPSVGGAALAALALLALSTRRRLARIG